MKKNFIIENGLQDYIRPYSKWWYAYYEMVGANYTAGSEWGFHRHHIIPRCLYRNGVLPNDNGQMDSPYNVINVPPNVHSVLHFLLYKAAKPGWFKDSMAWAYKELEKVERGIYGTKENN